MKELTLIFELEDDVDTDDFEEDLGKALDDFGSTCETELNKCIGWRMKNES